MKEVAGKISALWIGLFVVYAIATAITGEDGPQVYLTFVFPFVFLIGSFLAINNYDKENNNKTKSKYNK